MKRIHKSKQLESRLDSLHSRLEATCRRKSPKGEYIVFRNGRYEFPERVLDSYLNTWDTIYSAGHDVLRDTANVCADAILDDLEGWDSREYKSVGLQEIYEKADRLYRSGDISEALLKHVERACKR